jgi:hypothetical protein
MTDTSKYKPTTRLRWVIRTIKVPTSNDIEGALLGGTVYTDRVLQQWWGEPMPGYMANSEIGEWRDIPEGMEAP